MTQTELECAIALYLVHGVVISRDGEIFNEAKRSITHWTQEIVRKHCQIRLHPLFHGKDLKSMYDSELNKLHAGTITVHALTYGCLQYAVRNQIDIFNLIESGYAVAI